MFPEIQTCSSSAWQSQLRDVITSADELLALLDLTPEDIVCSPAASKDFPLKVPHAFARRMCPGNPHDPLLLQVIASPQELDTTPGYSTDPLAEQGQANPRRGIIHKYHGRALLLATGACAVHCRYCFRRHFPYAENRNSRFEWRDTLSYIAADPDISEVILSGGDPLVLTDEHLKELVTGIAAIPSVKRLRIHSRLPIVIPDRITSELVRLLTGTRLELILVIHANHGNEIDSAVKEAMQALKGTGVTLLNQSVLLRNINDNADALVTLSEKLFDAGVLPYYLHLLDPVQGAAHFDVPEEYAKELLREASARLPGYLVPRLVREVPEALSKTLIA